MVAFTNPNIQFPVNSVNDGTWVYEIEDVERTIAKLLAAKQQTFRDNPQYEQVLWLRYRQRLLDIKRSVDAVCL